MTIKDENVAAALNISSQVNRPDLLIVHAQKHSLWQRLFSKSVTKSLAFESEIPVLVIH
jgi:nucleotide-binding universal stress UspA family protein